MLDVPNNLTAPRIAGVILAGGLSRRMFIASGSHGHKGLLPLGASTMLGRVVARFRPQVTHLALNANGDPERFAEFGLPVIADTVAGYVGPLAGVLAGMRWAAVATPDASHVVTVPADAPFLPTDLAARLLEAALSHPGAIALARSGGNLHPVAAAWPIIHADHLEAALSAGTRKVLRWTDEHFTMPVDFAPLTIGATEVDPFFNANTPAELDVARRLLAGERP